MQSRDIYTLEHKDWMQNRHKCLSQSVSVHKALILIRTLEIFCRRPKSDTYKGVLIFIDVRKYGLKFLRHLAFV